MNRPCLAAIMACNLVARGQAIDMSPAAPAASLPPGDHLLDVARHRAACQSSSIDDDHTAHLVTDGSDLTYWECRPGGDQWVSIDLGEAVPIRQLTLHWGKEFPRVYRVQISIDGDRAGPWTTVYRTDQGRGRVEQIRLKPVVARQVRLVGTASNPDRGFVLSRFEVWGVQNPRPPSGPLPVLAPGGSLLTNGWRLQSSLFVTNPPEQISSAGFDSHDWLPALVPGTVLASYLAAGAIPDPRYANQQTQISEDFFTRHDFWYRLAFVISPDCRGRRLWLVFDGINWKAEVYLNGNRLGQIDGAFIRGRFDITPAAVCGGTNYLAVRVRRVEHPGKPRHKQLGRKYPNGGVLGLDSPTFVSSIGWNWLPTIRGRNVGIWNDVRFETSGDAVLVDPWVTSELPSPDHVRAELTVRSELRNLSNQPRHCRLTLSLGRLSTVLPPSPWLRQTNRAPSPIGWERAGVRVRPSEIDGRGAPPTDHTLSFHHELTLQPHETRSVVIDKSNCPDLVLEHPRLWWPNGYGDPNLYTMTLRLESDGVPSDEKRVTFGIRKLDYRVEKGVLHLYVNGSRILCRGGNWGMEDGMLLCDADGYDLRVRLHQDMHLVMIRNWVGMVGRDAFYDACDRHGLLVWDDFWLANPVDGPDPADAEMFLKNVRDKVRRVRSHPCLALYCGRNEGFPPPDLDQGMREATLKLDGTRYYLSHSATGVVSGFGPYEVQAPAWYFEHRGATFHSELGIVCVPPVESLRRMLPESDLWPINDLWAVHDYQTPRAPLYTRRIADRYGTPTGIEDYCRKAQLLNLETAKAMYECLQSGQGGGLLVWMTQPAWPSVICQLYDYYFEPTAAYFGAKTACEPLHILWDQSDNSVKVANDTPARQPGLRAEAWIYDLAGRERWHHAVDLDLPATTARDCFKLEPPADLSRVHFVKLKLSRDGKVVSDNFYWTGGASGDCTDLANLPRVSLDGSASMEREGDACRVTATVSNPASSVALAIRLKLVRDGSGARVLPAFYDDNYFSLLPGESKTVSIRFRLDALAGETPRLLAEGWNIAAREIPIH